MGDTRATTAGDRNRECQPKQLTGLDDLREFLASHGPDSGKPMPLRRWQVDELGRIRETLDHEDVDTARRVLDAFAALFGTTVATEHRGRWDGEERAELSVRGWIGPVEDPHAGHGRTLVQLTFTTPIDLLRPENRPADPTA